VEVLAQLGNRVQHALRAFTPKDQKAVKVAAETFRANPAFKTEEVITQLGVGEALLSMLEEKGAPGIVQRALICPPASRIGAITEAERQAIIEQSPVRGLYDRVVDRESAYELLTRRAAEQPESKAPAPRGRRTQSIGEQVVKTMVRTATSAAARRLTTALVRGLLGSLARR
jgi:DNA helicase HerA-like ATPase